MPDTIYIRKDDPAETVRIISQERMPNGTVKYEFLSPPSAEGKTNSYGAHVFHSLYRNSNDRNAANDVPSRPHSVATRDQWRDYALWLEREYGHFHVEPPKPTDTPFRLPGDDTNTVDTLGTIGRKSRV